MYDIFTVLFWEISITIIADIYFTLLYALCSSYLPGRQTPNLIITIQN